MSHDPIARLDAIDHLAVLFFMQPQGRSREDKPWEVLAHTSEHSRLLQLLHSFQDRNSWFRPPARLQELLDWLSPAEQAWMTSLLQQLQDAPPLRIRITAHSQPFLFPRAAKGSPTAAAALLELVQRHDLRPAYHLHSGWKIITPLLQPLIHACKNPSDAASPQTIAPWVHPSARMHPTSQLGAAAQIEQGACVGRNTQLGGLTLADTTPLPPTLLGTAAMVPDHCRVHAILESNAVLSPQLSIGPGSHLELLDPLPADASSPLLTSMAGLPRVPAGYRAFPHPKTKRNAQGYHQRILLSALSPDVASSKPAINKQIF